MKSVKNKSPLGLLSSFKTTETSFKKLQSLESYSMDREEQLAHKYEQAFKSRDKLSPLTLRLEISLAPTLIREFKRFFSLGLLFPESKYPFVPGPTVDFVWHELIVDTNRYFELCNQIYGKYVHHNPLTPEQVAKNTGEVFGFTKDCLKLAYGALTPSIWGSDVPHAGCDYQQTWKP